MHKFSLLLIFVILFFEGTNPVQARADQIREKVSPGVEDRILTPEFSSPPLERNPFSPPFTTKAAERPKGPISKEIKPPDNIRLTGIIGNKSGKSVIIKISGESYLVHEGDSIGAANQELKVLKITNKKVIIEKGSHFFTLMFPSQAK